LEAHGTPLEAITSELLAASRSRPGLLAQLSVGPFWIDVVRGPDHAEPGSFRLSPAGG
jgi:hypothetical protein